MILNGHLYFLSDNIITKLLKCTMFFFIDKQTNMEGGQSGTHLRLTRASSGPRVSIAKTHRDKTKRKLIFRPDHSGLPQHFLYWIFLLKIWIYFIQCNFVCICVSTALELSTFGTIQRQSWAAVSEQATEALTNCPLHSLPPSLLTKLRNYTQKPSTCKMNRRFLLLCTWNF